jgi:hypothetical protein
LNWKINITRKPLDRDEDDEDDEDDENDNDDNKKKIITNNNL